MAPTKKIPSAHPILDAEDFEKIPGALDREPSAFFRLAARALSPKVIIDAMALERLRELARNSAVVYALKHRSVYDLQLLRMKCAEWGLPQPLYAFDLSPHETGSIGKSWRVWKHKLSGLYHERAFPKRVNERVLARIFENGAAAALFLVDEHTSSERFRNPDQDPIKILMDVQGRFIGTIAVLPVSILYDRTPPKSVKTYGDLVLGATERPNLLRRLMLAVRKWTVPELLVGEPTFLMEEFPEFNTDKDFDEAPYAIRSRLLRSINDRIRVNRGPTKLSRTEIKERVLQDPRVQRALSSSDEEPESILRKKAERYVDEIMANQSFQVHHVLYYVLRGLFSKVFDGVDLKESDFSMLKAANGRGSLIFVSCHKSHFDYLLIGFFCFINQMTIPLMAAGKNLSFWPVGGILRCGGAFFIRRSFKGLSLYVHVFAAYLRELLNERTNINFYIEGGRSRTGKLMPPKVGMLGFLLQPLLEGDIADLTFVPTYAAYDQIPEEKSYLSEQAGKEKQAESFSAFLRARNVLKRRFGKVYLRFHEPISFREYCEENGIPLADFMDKTKRNRINDFAYYMMYSMTRVGIVSPVELTSAALICLGASEMSHDEIMENTGLLHTALGAKEVEFAAGLQNRENAIRQALDLCLHRKFITTPQPDVYALNAKARPNLYFYKNSLLNYLWAESLVSLLLTTPSSRLDDLQREFALLKSVSIREIIFNPLKTDEELVEEILESFAAQGWVVRENDSFTVKSAAALNCLGGLMYDILLTYRYVLEHAAHVETNLSAKDFRKVIVNSAKTTFPDDFRRNPPISIVTVGNALGRWSEMGILKYRESKKILVGVGEDELRLENLSLLGRVTGP